MSLREQLLNVARARQNESVDTSFMSLEGQEFDFVKQVEELKKDFVDLAKSGRLLGDGWVWIVPIPYGAVKVLYLDDLGTTVDTTERFKITITSPAYQELFAWLEREGVRTKVQKETSCYEFHLGLFFPTFWLAVQLPQL